MVQNEAAPPTTQPSPAFLSWLRNKPAPQSLVYKLLMYLFTLKLSLCPWMCFLLLIFLLPMKTAQVSSSDKWYLNFSH